PMVSPSGRQEVTRPPTQPRFDAGTYSCTSVVSTANNPDTPKPTKNRNTVRKIQSLSGVSAMMPVAMEKLSAVPMNALRRPILSAIQPQKNAPGTAPTPADSRIIADCPYV